MAKYQVQVPIKSNVTTTELYYDMQVYKEVNNAKFYLLTPTGKKQVQQGYTTEPHETIELTTEQVADAIIELVLYRKVGSEYLEALDEPFTAIYSITPVLRGKEQQPLLSRPYVKYFETVKDTQKSTDGNINIIPVAISGQERLFEAPEHPVGEPLDPFTKAKIDSGLIARLQRPYPDQDRSSLCGPAVFFYSLLKDRPDLYQQIIKDLWETGETKLGTLSIKPSNGCRHPTNFFYTNGNTRIPAIDWISLASLRDSENTFLNYDSPDDKAAGITMWGKIKEWFRKIGAERIFNNISIAHSNLQDAVNLSSYVGNGNHVVTLIGSGMLSVDGYRWKGHWIVWEDKLRLQKSDRIKSVRTLGNYEERLVQVAKNMSEYGLTGEIRDLTPQTAINYLEIRSEEIGQKTLDMERQAIQAMMHLMGTLPEQETLTVIKSEHEQLLVSRAYTQQQVEMIADSQQAKQALATKIAYSAGLFAPV